MESERVFNLNVGILGHIDSGKTSLARVLSTVLSTAALDKSPQSQERGITLDLGFSALTVPMPAHLSTEYSQLRLTLVDCPGHASLIRTIVAGASIIDRMILVVDATKGVQTQTAECIVIAELMIKGTLVVALNKVDMQEEAKVVALEKRVLGMLAKTKFGGDVRLVRTAATPRTGDPIGIQQLIDALIGSLASLPLRNPTGPLIYAIDHCFPLKGQGTVMTGTILQGELRVGNSLEIVDLGVCKKVKSMQSFHQAVTSASQGDRVGVRVTQFEAETLERGLASTPGTLRKAANCLIQLNPIVHYKQTIRNKAKFHILLGNETAMGNLLLFSCSNSDSEVSFDPSLEYFYEDEVRNDQTRRIFAVISFETPVVMVPNALLIGSKLDTDVNAKTCRLAFHGSVLACDVPLSMDYLKIFKPKCRAGEVDRVTDPYTAIVKDLFKKGTDIGKFTGLKVRLEPSGAEGTIEGSFGGSGKCRVVFPAGNAAMGSIVLPFKKMLFDTANRLFQ